KRFCPLDGDQQGADCVAPDGGAHPIDNGAAAGEQVHTDGFAADGATAGVFNLPHSVAHIDPRPFPDGRCTYAPCVTLERATAVQTRTHHTALDSSGVGVLDDSQIALDKDGKAFGV